MADRVPTIYIGMSTAAMDINGWQSILERLSESCKA